jgi:hypothetical protein
VSIEDELGRPPGVVDVRGVATRFMARAPEWLADLAKKAPEMFLARIQDAIRAAVKRPDTLPLRYSEDGE